MKVVHLIDSGGFFGAERVLVTLALEQQRHGYDVKIVSCGNRSGVSKPFEEECRKAGLNLIVWSGKTFFQLQRLQYENQNAIFHSHGYKFNILLALLRLRFWSTANVATVHGYTNAPKFSRLRFYYFLNKLALTLLSGVVFVSNQTVQDSGSLLNDRNRIIYNGISNKCVADVVDDIEPNFLGKKYLIAVGRLSAEKAYGDLIKAFSEVSKRDSELMLLIVGDGSERAYLERLALGLDRIYFLGHKTNPLPYIKHSRLLVISSKSEGLPIVLLEAMQNGVDVVSSRVGAIPDVIEDGRSGLLYDAGNIDQLIDCINSALNLEKGEMGLQAQVKFVNEFTSVTMYEQYDDWYRFIS
jgi:glycosyltransferase involved in cell wall biosynthesis